MSNATTAQKYRTSTQVIHDENELYVSAKDPMMKFLFAVRAQMDAAGNSSPADPVADLMMFLEQFSFAWAAWAALTDTDRDTLKSRYAERFTKELRGERVGTEIRAAMSAQVEVLAAEAIADRLPEVEQRVRRQIDERLEGIVEELVSVKLRDLVGEIKRRLASG